MNRRAAMELKRPFLNDYAPSLQERGFHLAVGLAGTEEKYGLAARLQWQGDGNPKTVEIQQARESLPSEYRGAAVHSMYVGRISKSDRVGEA